MKKYILGRLQKTDMLDAFLSFALGIAAGVLVLMWLP